MSPVDAVSQSGDIDGNGDRASVLIVRLASRDGFGERLRDFWYFNDFYVLCLVLIGALLYAIVSYQ